MHGNENGTVGAITVSVIVPTTCQASRRDLITRAIESIVSQSGVTLEVLIVANGDKCDRSLIKTLEGDSRLHVIRQDEGNVSAARYEGLRRATGDFFCFLDDDDEFLPNALNTRVRLFGKDETADVVVTNGFEHIAGKDAPLVTIGASGEIQLSPGQSFFRQNWFASPAALFRANSIDPELFNFSFKYFEWTYLFFMLLAKGKHFHYDESLTYRKYEDNPLSISKSNEYALAYPDFLRTLAKLPLEPSIKHAIQDKYASSLNTQSTLELAQGHRLLAWRAHLKCLMNGGWNYLPYTRRLLIP